MEIYQAQTGIWINRLNFLMFKTRGGPLQEIINGWIKFWFCKFVFEFNCRLQLISANSYSKQYYLARSFIWGKLVSVNATEIWFEGHVYINITNTGRVILRSLRLNSSPKLEIIRNFIFQTSFKSKVTWHVRRLFWGPK